MSDLNQKEDKTMKTDKFTKGCLLAVVVLLAVLLIKPYFEANVAYAAKGVEYKVVWTGCDDRKELDIAACYQKELNGYGREGWELVGTGVRGMWVFKR